MNNIILKSLNIIAIDEDKKYKVMENDRAIDILQFDMMLGIGLIETFNKNEQACVIKNIGETDHKEKLVQITMNDLDLIFIGNRLASIIVHMDNITNEQFLNLFIVNDNYYTKYREIFTMVYNKAIFDNYSEDWKLLELDNESIKIRTGSGTIASVKIYARLTDDSKHELCFDIKCLDKHYLGYSYIKTELKVRSIEIATNDTVLIIDRDKDRLLSLYGQVIETLGHTPVTRDGVEILYFNIGSDNLKVEGSIGNDIYRLAFSIEEANKITLIANNGVRHNLGNIMNKMIMLGDLQSYNKIGFKNAEIANIGTVAPKKDNLYRLLFDLKEYNRS